MGVTKKKFDGSEGPNFGIGNRRVVAPVRGARKPVIHIQVHTDTGPQNKEVPADSVCLGIKPEAVTLS